jgi:bifunctional UDP-N-acetylglucosamine pyrophosphorylase/glucosamine-1-phosphate N-acetyltransferase
MNAALSDSPQRADPTTGKSTLTYPRPTAVVVLAAGEGTRMRSATPKPLHAIAGRTLLGHALAAAKDLDPRQIVVVVRHGREGVTGAARAIVPEVLIADQDEIPGTGRAVQCAIAALDAASHADDAGPHPSAPGGDVVVIPADAPLVDGATLAQVRAAHVADANAVTLLTARVDDPVGYGRIVRDATTGDVLRIVEERDATPAERAIDEVNASMYVFDLGVLRAGLAALGRGNAQGEVYLTDVVALARANGGRTRAILADDPYVVRGVNDRVQLAVLAREFNRRRLIEAMTEGVTVLDPATTWIDVDVELSPDVTVLPGTIIHAGSTVERDAVIGPDTTLVRTRVGAGAIVNRVHAVDAIIGPGANVGPFTHLRPGTVLGERAKAGSFVELKAADVGDGAKVPHLSYVGDAIVGEGANIGAATIVANYDGVSKSKTVVGPHARIGSDTMLVAPVRVGAGAYTGAGSVIRHDVPPGALAVSDVHQRTTEGWVAARRPGTDADIAAAAALTTEDSPATECTHTEGLPS